jgi:hypothetical protein
MRAAETAHALLFLVVLLGSAIAFGLGWHDAAGWWLPFNVLFNAYPVMLQRYSLLPRASPA